MEDSLDALQDFHQLGLLVRGHPSEHGGSQSELERPRVDRKRNSNKYLHFACLFVCFFSSVLRREKGQILKVPPPPPLRGGGACTFCRSWGKCSLMTAKAFPLTAK